MRSIQAVAAGLLAAGMAFSAGAGAGAGAAAGVGAEGPAPAPLVVALDPGHGGRDPGAMADGMVEKELTLAFARELAAAIDRETGLEAVLTRDDDSYVPLPERIGRARRVGAGLMISLHADMLAEGRAEGVSVYSLGPAAGGADAGTADLVRGRARAHLIAGSTLEGEPDALAETLVGLARRDTLPASEALARALVAALDGAVPVLDKRPHRHAAFAVLKAADLPAVLVELGFMDNARDRRRLGSAVWRKRTIGAMIGAVRAWNSAHGAAAPGPETGQMQGRNSLAGETARTAAGGTMRHRGTFAVQPTITLPADHTR